MLEEKDSSPAAGPYWFDAEDDEVARAIEVLRALRRFRRADSVMRQQTQAAMAMNETDLLAIRHLIAAERLDRVVSPKSLTAVLGISSAATAKLLSRLAGTGYIHREPHPTDRRAQILSSTPLAHREVRRTLGSAHQRMIAVAEGLNPREQDVVIGFLDALSDAVATGKPETSA